MNLEQFRAPSEGGLDTIEEGDEQEDALGAAVDAFLDQGTSEQKSVSDDSSDSGDPTFNMTSEKSSKLAQPVMRKKEAASLLNIIEEFAKNCP